MLVRLEQLDDQPAIRAVNEAAFQTSAEADIVDALRAKSMSLISLVAESKGKIVGHIMFSPASLPGRDDFSLMGLGPMAVAPGHQRKGVGSALIHRGLKICREQGHAAVVVVGHPKYYPRFGFVPASRFGINCEWNVPDEVFMVAELQPGSLQGVSGTVAYDEAFSRV